MITDVSGNKPTNKSLFLVLTDINSLTPIKNGIYCYNYDQIKEILKRYEINISNFYFPGNIRHTSKILLINKKCASRANKFIKQGEYWLPTGNGIALSYVYDKNCIKNIGVVSKKYVIKQKINEFGLLSEYTLNKDNVIDINSPNWYHGNGICINESDNPFYKKNNPIKDKLRTLNLSMTKKKKDSKIELKWVIFFIIILLLINMI